MRQAGHFLLGASRPRPLRCGFPKAWRLAMALIADRDRFHLLPTNFFLPSVRPRAVITKMIPSVPHLANWFILLPCNASLPIRRPHSRPNRSTSLFDKACTLIFLFNDNPVLPDFCGPFPAPFPYCSLFRLLLDRTAVLPCSGNGVFCCCFC